MLMKTKTLKIFLLILICIGCKNKTAESEQLNAIHSSGLEKEIDVENQDDSTEMNSESNNKMFDFLSAKYSKVYEYQGTNSRQLIGITFISKDSIDYYLSSETMPCDTEYYGKAFKNNDWNLEIDMDDDGYGYEANEYTIDQPNVFYIRVALDSTKVKIKYIDNATDGTNCVPIRDVVMRRIE